MIRKTEIERIHLVFVAGPYRAATEWGIRKNIEKCADRAMDVWRLNRNGAKRVAAVAPCLNSSFFGGEIPDEMFLAADQAMLLRCDALMTADGWEGSKGALAEIKFAGENGIGVFYSIRELDEWLEARDRELGLSR